MLALLFANPGFLLIAAALISVPIIIHLINRMRFKRIRWAAMEFLLKAAKRTRRRLIIEQLLLLALRCLLIALVGLLVSKFIGCGDSNTIGKPNLHLVLLDDTLSMQDTWKPADGPPKNCFDVAKTDFIIKKIAKGLNRSNDRLVVIQMSKIDDKSYVPKAYERLNDKSTHDTLTQDITEMQPTMLHVSMKQGINAAKQIMTNYSDSAVTLHIISDFRETDWGAAAGEGLNKLLLELVQKNKDVKIRVIDTVDPPRVAGQNNRPKEHDNVGIVDFRPSTRVVGKKVAVKFSITIKNFSGAPKEAYLEVRNEVTGKDLPQIDFNPISRPAKLSPGSTTEVTFERGDLRTGLFFDDIKSGQSEFAHLSVRLVDAGKQPLADDGLLADNIRHTVVEVRDTVPILIIDGEGSRGREENKDSFMLARAAISPGKSYEVEFGDVLSPGNPTRALERPDLGKYPLIYLLNVRDLNPKQVANLENYVKEGGGLAFFMGPNVNAAEYNKTLYKKGEGIFPAPLMSPYYPPFDKKDLPIKESDSFQLLIRDDQFPPNRVPIFSEMFPEPNMRQPLRIFPIHRYFKVDRAAWKPEKGRVFELATLPNDDPADGFHNQLAAITQTGQAIGKVRVSKEFKTYGARFNQLLQEAEKRVGFGKEFKAYHLAEDLEKLLTDKGQKGVVPDMTEFWASPDPSIQTLQGQLTRLREQVHYGDPFVVAQTFGRGKVVAVMTTAGKDWNKWSGGTPLVEMTFPMFVMEAQNWLSSPGDEGNLTVGTNDLNITLDAEPFQGKKLKLVRNYWKVEPAPSPATAKEGEARRLRTSFWKNDPGVKAVPEESKRTEERGEPNENGKIVFALNKHDVPGLYTSELFEVFEDDPAPKLIAKFAHAFNVDTVKEGQLQRVGSEELERDLVAKSEKRILVVSVNAPEGTLVAKTDDFSESPWLFLILLLVLVAEQALAVHLSFHLKNTENEITPAGAKS